MKILFNSSTNIVGGPVQNAVNFILAACRDRSSEIRWFHAMSEAVAKQVPEGSVAGEVFEASPSQNLSSRQRLLQLVRREAFDGVYTMAGPAYVAFPCLHVMGCSNPYVTNLDWRSLTYNRTPIQVTTTMLRTAYQAYHFRRADRWLFQTEASRQGFIRRLRIPRSRTAVVPNALGAAFADPGQSSVAVDGEEPIKRIFVPSADYPHKALPMVVKVAAELAQLRPQRDFRFILTLPDNSVSLQKISRRSYRNDTNGLIQNIGPFEHAAAPELYAQSAAVFLPSILEVFSTSYIEAISMRRPLVVPELDFAIEICGDAARYFTPLDARHAAGRLNDALQTGNELTDSRRGSDSIVNRYPDYIGRYDLLKAQILRWSDSAGTAG